MSTPITRARFDEICLHFAEQYLISRDLAQDATEENPAGRGMRLTVLLPGWPEEERIQEAHEELAAYTPREILDDVTRLGVLVVAFWDRADMPHPSRVPVAPIFAVGQRVVMKRDEVKTQVGRLVRLRLPTGRTPSDWFIRVDARPGENLRPTTPRSRFPWAASVRTVYIVTARIPAGLRGTIIRAEIVQRGGVDYSASYEVRWDEPVVPASTLAARVEPMEPEAQHRTSYTWWACMDSPLPFTEASDGQG